MCVEQIISEVPVLYDTAPFQQYVALPEPATMLAMAVLVILLAWRRGRKAM